MSLMSSSKFGKCSSARFRPRAEKASIQTILLSSSRIPLRMVFRSQPNSRSAFRCPPLPSAFTVLAINSRRALPFSSLAVSIKSDLTSGVSSIFPSQILCLLCAHHYTWENLFLASPLENLSHENWFVSDRIRLAFGFEGARVLNFQTHSKRLVGHVRTA